MWPRPELVRYLQRQSEGIKEVSRMKQRSSAHWAPFTYAYAAGHPGSRPEVLEDVCNVSTYDRGEVDSPKRKRSSQGSYQMQRSLTSKSI